MHTWEHPGAADAASRARSNCTWIARCPSRAEGERLCRLSWLEDELLALAWVLVSSSHAETGRGRQACSTDNSAQAELSTYGYRDQAVPILCWQFQAMKGWSSASVDQLACIMSMNHMVTGVHRPSSASQAVLKTLTGAQHSTCEPAS